MTEAEKLREAQEFITRALQEKGAGRIDAVTWDQGLRDWAVGIYRLTVVRSGEKGIFTFSKYELLENFDSKRWEKELRTQVGEILIELRDE